jgi:oligosaccharide repeat unit polymerase
MASNTISRKAAAPDQSQIKAGKKLSFGKTLSAFFFTGPVWILVLGTSPSAISSSTVVLAQTFLVVLSAFMFTLEFRRSSPSPLILMLWVFNCGNVGVPGLTQLLSGVEPWPIVIDDNTYLIAQVATVTASIFLIFLLSLPQKELKKIPPVRNLSRFRLRNLLILMIPMSVYAIQTGGGIGAYFGSRGAVSNAKALAGVTKAQNGLFVSGSQAIVLVVFVCALRLRKINKDDPIVQIGLYLSGLLLIILANPLSSSRYWFFTVIATVTLVTVRLTPGRIRFGAISIFYGLLLVFPFADYFRRSVHTVGAIGKSAWLTGDYDGLQISAAGIQWFEYNGAVWGHQLLGALFPVIPRSFWTSKPVDTGIMIAQANGMKFRNISGPWIAEAVINFGYAGLIIFPILIAYFFRRIRFRSVTAPDDFGIVLNGFLVGYLPILLRGSLIQASGVLGLFVLFILYLTPKQAGTKISIREKIERELTAAKLSA